MMFYTTNIENSSKDVNWLIVIPDRRKEYILKQLHDAVTGGEKNIVESATKIFLVWIEE